jgi:Ca2+-binding RTX toxin-like protein
VLFRSADITGSGANANDTLTLTDDDQTVDNATFANKTSVETLVLANGTNTVTLNANAAAAGIEVVVGGAGNDALTFDTTLQTALIFNGGAQTTFDSAIISNAGATFGDAYFVDWSSVERLTTANGNNNITLGENALTAGIATITGGTGNDTFNASAYTIAATLIGGDGNDSMLSGSASDSLFGGAGTDWLQGTSATSAGANQIDTLTGSAGNDTFVLGDSSNAYYNTAENGGDYAVIMDFAVGDRLQLKTLDPDLTGNGYVIGNSIYGVVGSSNYYLYRDSNNNGAVESGDNLIAAINSSVVLTTDNLKSTHGSFV